MCSKVLPSHDYHVGQCVVYQDPDNTIKWWYPATITSLCAEKRTYMINDTNCTMYKLMQAHLMSYTLQDKNCQSTQCEYMWPVKPAMTQTSHMWSVKPAMPQTSHMHPVKVIEQSNHKKSQVKPVMAQSSHTWPMSNAVRKQFGKQPELVRNSDKHAVLPTHAPYVGQQVMFEDSTSKHCYPAVSVNLCPDSRSYKITTMQSVNPVKI